MSMGWCGSRRITVFGRVCSFTTTRRFFPFTPQRIGKAETANCFYETFDEHNELADFLLQRRKNFKEQLEQMRKRFYGDE